MGQLHLPGSPPIAIALQRSARARRISLRVSRLDGQVTLSLPCGTPEAEGLAFAHAKAAWLRRVLAARAPMEPVRIGGRVPLEGRMLQLRAAGGRGLRLEDATLHVPGDPARAGPRTAAWLKVLARERLAAACDRHARVLGVGYLGPVLRDTRSRWGSCAADGRLMFSWRLIMAPPEVLDYVAAHEVAHRLRMDHSPAFWGLVERLCPAWRARRDWLRAHGQALHGWRFEAQP